MSLYTYVGASYFIQLPTSTVLLHSLLKPTCRTSFLPSLRTNLTLGNTAAGSHSQTLLQNTLVRDQPFCFPILSILASSLSFYLPYALVSKIWNDYYPATCCLVVVRTACKPTVLTSPACLLRFADPVSTLLPLWPWRKRRRSLHPMISIGHLLCDTVHSLDFNRLFFCPTI